MGMYALDNTNEPPSEYVFGPCYERRYFDNRLVLPLGEATMLRICEDFAYCAEKAKRMGLDGVLIHGGHGVLMGQFLSRSVNKRVDEYGGSLENRARFPLVILKSIREHVGGDRGACSVNPVLPLDYEGLRVRKADEPRRVVVIGGGPGGMKAALTAAERGHDVVLLECKSALGGTLRFADGDECKIDIKTFKDNMIKNISLRSNIEVRTGVEATPELVKAENADAVIVALGAVSRTPDIPGLDSKTVISAMDVYDYPEAVGQNVVFVGGGLTACETAVHLAHLGKNVTVVGRNAYLAPELGKARVSEFQKTRMNPAAALEDQFERYSIDTYEQTRCTEVTDRGVKAVNADGDELLISADTVVIAVGMDARSAQAELFRGTAPLYYNVGDSKRAGTIARAISDAHNAAMDID